jgi:hypothetical protein
VWNELWHVKNVPSDGKLKVAVYDKDDGSVDQYIGTSLADWPIGEGVLAWELIRIY